MSWRMIAAATAALAAGCSTEPAAPDRNEAAAAAPAANESAAAVPANPIQTRYDRTMTDQPLNRPPEPLQLLVTRATFPSGHVISCHRHTWPRYVYLQQGNLRVTNHDTGIVRDFSAGEVVVELYGQWHEGLVTSREPLMLVAVEQVPPGGNNSTPCPAPAGP